MISPHSSLIALSVVLSASAAEAAQSLKDVPVQPNPTDVRLTPAADAADLTLDRADGIALTLEQSVEMAIRGATSVLKASNDNRNSGAALLQAYGQFLPNLTSTANANYNTGTTYYTIGAPSLVKGSGTNTGFVVQSDLNLFNGLADISNLKSSILKKDSTELTLYRAKQAIALDISQDFLQVVLDNKLVAIATKNLQESREREKLLEEQTRVGARNLSDLFRQEAQTSQDESTLINQQNQTRTDQIIFLRKLRVDVAKNYHFIEPKIPEGRTLESLEGEDKLIATALEHRSDLKSSNETADASQWDVHSAFSTYLPKIDLIAGLDSGAHYLYSQSVNGANVMPPSQTGFGSQLPNQIDYTVGVYLSWSLFDRFITHQNVVRARVVADDAQIDAEDRKNQVEGDVRQAYGNYVTALQQLRASKKGIEAAQKAYEVMEGRYEVGGASFLDLLTSQTSLVQAESARAQALIYFQLQNKTLDFALGTTRVDGS
jgi:outer membrane protein